VFLDAAPELFLVRQPTGLDQEKKKNAKTGKKTVRRASQNGVFGVNLFLGKNMSIFKNLECVFVFGSRIQSAGAPIHGTECKKQL
jgi:chromosome condensin MukBEF MukE localization factor